MQAYVQVVVSGTGGQRWTVSDFQTKKSVILAGLGWGGLPDHVMAAELESGALVPLNVEGFPPRYTGIFAIRRRDRPMGRVMSDIWAALQARAPNPPGA